MSDAAVSAISEPSTPERVFKVVFVGDSGVGKSSFIHRFCHDAWKPSFTATIGKKSFNGPFAASGHMVHAGGQAAHWDIQNKATSSR